MQTLQNTEKQSLLEQNENKRTKCLVYTRVMGYHRPVESFNIGKKGEHRQRQHFIQKGN
ncbi:MAG: anaerobic ribonucleoside-triphosphate reductase [Cyclobacteriaceae bacterium]